MGRSPADTVVAFNEAINARDLDRLVALMTPGHRFVDAAGGVVEGRDAGREAWRSFFESFPDYRNVFTAVAVRSPSEVVALGHSECTVEALRGPARWHAVVAGDLVDEWRVEDAPVDADEEATDRA
ncbi:MAG: nuclear transport factor 2 family protein [Acidimicrobiales bacterium]|nr:nuclear transport factor 2 family protein [Acidimicrobiales bacterium]